MRIIRAGLHLLAPLGGLALVYGLLASQAPGFDAMVYGLDIERDRLPLHPHHVLSAPLQLLAWRAWSWLGLSGRPLEAFQAANALLSAGASVLLGLGLLFITRSLASALIPTLALAFTHAFLLAATDGDVYATPLLLCSALLAALWAARTTRHALATGLLHAMACLAHQSVLLTLPACALAWLLPLSPGRPLRWRQALAHSATTVTLAMAGTLVAAVLAGHGHDPLRWATTYAHQGFWGHWHSTSLFAALEGLRGALYPGGLLQASLSGASPVLMLIPLVMAALAVAMLLASGLAPLLRRPALVGAAWFVPAFVFAAWWDPLNGKFYLLPLLGLAPPLALLIRYARRPVAARALAGLLAFFLGTVNLLSPQGALARLSPDADPALPIARALASQARPHDLFILPSGRWEILLPYLYDTRPVLSLHHLLASHHDDLPRALEALRAHIKEARDSGASVFVSSEALNPSPQLMSLHPHIQAQSLRHGLLHLLEPLKPIKAHPPLLPGGRAATLYLSQPE